MNGGDAFSAHMTPLISLECCLHHQQIIYLLVVRRLRGRHQSLPSESKGISWKTFFFLFVINVSVLTSEWPLSHIWLMMQIKRVDCLYFDWSYLFLDWLSYQEIVLRNLWNKVLFWVTYTTYFKHFILTLSSKEASAMHENASQSLMSFYII